MGTSPCSVGQTHLGSQLSKSKDDLRVHLRGGFSDEDVSALNELGLPRRSVGVASWYETG